MDQDVPLLCTAFLGQQRVAAGGLADVAVKAREALDRTPDGTLLIFDNATSRVIDVDLRGTSAEVRTRIDMPISLPVRSPGRPKLGVVAREVTLLPRHWDWLSAQPGGASVALRKLVEMARRAGDGKDRAHLAQDATYRFMAAMAGDRPGFEEAARGLFAGNKLRFEECTEAWPNDVRYHARALAEAAFI